MIFAHTKKTQNKAKPKKKATTPKQTKNKKKNPYLMLLVLT
jgi:hypothetical protein